MDRSYEVLVAVRKALTSNTELNTKVGGRFEYSIDQNQNFPCVLLTIQHEANDTKTEEAGLYTVRIQAFSRTEDQDECLQIKSKIYNTLHRHEESIDLNGLIQCIQRGANTVFREDDGVTFQAVMDFKLNVEG